MPTSLLKTKLYTPSLRAQRVLRPRLIERLKGGLLVKLTLVSAPAGYGKTTLVADWLRQARQPSAWLSLDRADNDPARFLTYLIAALQVVRPDMGEDALAVLQGPGAAGGPQMEPLLAILINELAALPEQAILVLDDYHTIDEPSIHQAVSFLLDHLPPHVHLVIATRADPPLPVARLRARGQLVEVHAADLRFTQAEAAAFLQGAMGLTLSAEHVAALERRTEGWAAGLQLAAISAQGHDDIASFVAAFAGSHRHVLDYLTEEVLNQQSEDIRAFLLQTAVLDGLVGPLCDAVTGRTGSQATLEALDAANMFVVPLDDERRWYRYHQLFADLLRHHLQRECGELVPELHRRASAWYEESGMVREAVRHALAAEEFERAADLVERGAWAILMRGELTTVLGWLDRLPEELLRSRPRLGFFRAWALAYKGELDAVEPCLQGLGAGQLEGEVAAVRAHVAAVRGDVGRAIELARRASAHLPKENLFLRGVVAQTLGLAYHWSGNPGAAGEAFREAIRLSREGERPHLTLTATGFLGRAQEMHGALHEAAETYRAMLTLASRPGRRPVPFACMAHVGMAGPLYEWDDLEGATEHAAEGRRLSGLGGFVPYELAACAILARVHLAQRDAAGARAVIEEAERLAQHCDYAYVLAMLAEVRTRLWLVEGDLASASRWAAEHRLSAGDELSSAREVEQLAVARVLAAGGDSNGALALLAQLLEAAEAMGRMASVVKVLALQAVALQGRGEREQALRVLGRALSLVEPEGYVRTFLDEGEPMAALLRRALATGIAPGYAAGLLAALGEAGAASSAAESLVEPLSEREITVLRLMAAGMTNPEIARELVIAVSTVKSHVNHIYGKLGAKNRVHALERARALGLL